MPDLTPIDPIPVDPAFALAVLFGSYVQAVSGFAMGLASALYRNGFSMYATSQ